MTSNARVVPLFISNQANTTVTTTTTTTTRTHNVLAACAPRATSPGALCHYSSATTCGQSFDAGSDLRQLPKMDPSSSRLPSCKPLLDIKLIEDQLHIVSSSVLSTIVIDKK